MFGNLNTDVRQTLDHFHRSVDHLFESLFRDSGYRGTTSNGAEAVFAPAVESGWTDDSLNLRAILPGVSEKDLKVTVQGNQLVIEGERTAPEHLRANGGWTHMAYGKFYRTIDLPTGLDLDKLECRLHDGVLDIRAKITEAMKPRRIEIAGEKNRKAIAA
jgi:HSP20 family protein